MQERPLVSIVIPFYSGKHWLEEALDSVVSQEYNNKEILVINDGSKEDIEDIEKRFNEQVQFIKKKNEGPATARNLGIERATGKYIAFLDSDDVWIQGKLANQVALMEKQQAVWSQHSYEMFWEDSDKTKVVNTSIYTGNVYKDCFISFKIQTSCVMVKRSILIEENIRFPKEKRYGQDCEFYKRIAEKYELYSLPNIYSKFRIRGNNAGFRAIVQINDREETWREVKKNEKLLKELPILVKVAYKICEKESKFIKNKKIKSEKIAKFFYVIPWIMFKLYAKK